MERDTFVYGTDAAAPELSALVPVRVCTACGLEYTDGAAEEARHEAVCQHLRILTPQQIVGIRKSYGLTRAEFAALTRFGEASLARWEAGSILQNPANDQLLYLLQFRENAERLRERASGGTAGTPSAPAIERRFTVINIDEKRKEAQYFKLHTNAVA